MTEVSKADIHNILEGCRRKDRLYQKQLYEICYGTMMKICLRYHPSADEAGGSFNAAMFKVFANISQYKGEGELLAWVRRIIVNTCLTAIKKHSKFEFKELHEIHGDVVLEPEVYQSFNAREILHLVQELQETHRLVFNLFVMEGYSHEEIAAQLNIAKGTSKWYLHEAKKQLKEKIKLLSNCEINSDAI